MVSLPCTLGYMQDPSTHPELDSDLLLEAGSTSGPDRNWVYGISNTTAKDKWTCCSVSTIGSSQSGLSHQSSTV